MRTLASAAGMTTLAMEAMRARSNKSNKCKHPVCARKGEDESHNSSTRAYASVFPPHRISVPHTERNAHARVVHPYTNDISDARAPVMAQNTTSTVARHSRTHSIDATEERALESDMRPPRKRQVHPYSAVYGNPRTHSKHRNCVGRCCNRGGHGVVREGQARTSCPTSGANAKLRPDSAAQSSDSDVYCATGVMQETEPLPS